jgi:hypothetical protein
MQHGSKHCYASMVIAALLQTSNSGEAAEVPAHPPGMSQQRTVPSRLEDSSQRQSSEICISLTAAVWPRSCRTRRAACGQAGEGGGQGGTRSKRAGMWCSRQQVDGGAVCMCSKACMRLRCASASECVTNFFPQVPPE